MLAKDRSLPEGPPKITDQGGFIYLLASFLFVYRVVGCAQKDRIFFIELWIHNLFPTEAGKPKRSRCHHSGSKVISARGVNLGPFDPGAALLDLRAGQLLLQTRGVFPHTQGRFFRRFTLRRGLLGLFLRLVPLREEDSSIVWVKSAPG